MNLPITWNDVLALGPIAVVFAGRSLLVILESIFRKATALMFWVTVVVLGIAGGLALATVGSAWHRLRRHRASPAGTPRTLRSSSARVRCS